MTDFQELTETQANLLAQTLHEIRPDWTIKSMLRILWENRTQAPFPALTLAAVKAATTPTNRTPAVIFLEGKHWQGEAEQTHRPDTGPRCEDHPEEAAHNCRCCWADIKTGHRPQTHIGKHYEPQETA